MIETACAHARTRLWITIQSNGVERVRPICEDCCRLLPPVPKQQVAERYASLPRVTHAEAAERRSAAWLQAHEEKRRQERKAFFAEYNEYLRSEAWRGLRQRVLRRAGGICEGCLQRRATQVHHTTYTHVFAEFAFELVAVCDACHARLHPREDEAEGSPAARTAEVGS